MRKIIKGFLLQLQFLTRISLPVKIKFDKKVFTGAIYFLPLVGLLIGSLLGLTFYLVNFLDYKILTVFSVVCIEIAVTGGLHLDGLADSCDGLFSYRSRNKILKIMSDPCIGTNGTLALILIIILKILLLVIIPDKIILPLVIIMPVIGRMNGVYAAAISCYAKKEKSIAADMINHCSFKDLLIAVICTLMIVGLAFKLVVFLLLLVTFIFTHLICIYVKKRIFGITGDILGAIIELSEVVILFIIVIGKFYK